MSATIYAISLLLCGADPHDYDYILEWHPYTTTPVPIGQMEMECGRLLEQGGADNSILRGEVLLRRGVLRRWQMRSQDGDADLAEADRLLPNNADVRYEFIKTLIHDQNFDEAAKLGHALATQYPESFQGPLALAELHIARREFNQALKELKVASSRNSSVIRIPLQKCICNYHLQNWNDVIADSGRVLELGPLAPERVNFEFFAMRATALRFTGDYERAIGCAIASRDVDPTRSMGWANLWLCCMAGERSGLALRTAQEHVLRFPLEPRGHATLAISEAEHARLDIAEELARKAIRLDASGESAIAWNALGRVGWAKGDWSLAIEGFRGAVRIYDKDFDSRVRLAFLYAACPDEFFRDWEAASSLFRLIDSQKHWNVYSPRISLVAACVAAEHGEFTRAIELIKVVETRSKGDAALQKDAQDLLDLFTTQRPYRVAQFSKMRTFDLPILAWMADVSNPEKPALENQ